MLQCPVAGACPACKHTHSPPGPAVSAGVKGKASLLPCHMFAGMARPSHRLPSPANPPWVCGMPVCAPEHPLQHRVLRHVQLQETAKLPAAELSFQMFFLQIVAVQMHSCIFSLSAPSALHPPPHRRGVLPNPLALGWKGSTLNLYRESSGCQLLICHASSSVPCRNIVPARERQENPVKGLRQPLQSASCTSGCWRGWGGEGRGQAFPGGREGALAKMSPPKGTCTGCV